MSTPRDEHGHEWVLGYGGGSGLPREECVRCRVPRVLHSIAVKTCYAQLEEELAAAKELLRTRANAQDNLEARMGEVMKERDEAQAGAQWFAWALDRLNDLGRAYGLEQDWALDFASEGNRRRFKALLSGLDAARSRYYSERLQAERERDANAKRVRELEAALTRLATDSTTFTESEGVHVGDFELFFKVQGIAREALGVSEWPDQTSEHPEGVTPQEIAATLPPTGPEDSMLHQERAARDLERPEDGEGSDGT